MKVANQRDVPVSASHTREFLSTIQAAELLGFTPCCLNKWRRLGKGPRYVQTERGSIRYRRRDIDAYMAKCVREPEAACAAASE